MSQGPHRLQVRRVGPDPDPHYHRANPYFLYGWHTYQWAVWAPGPDVPPEIEVWEQFDVHIGEPDPNTKAEMLLATIEVNFDGIVSVVWGNRSEAYYGQSVPVSMKAHEPKTIDCFTLDPQLLYFVNAKWSGVLPQRLGGEFGNGRARALQSGELEAVAT